MWRRMQPRILTDRAGQRPSPAAHRLRSENVVRFRFRDNLAAVSWVEGALADAISSPLISGA